MSNNHRHSWTDDILPEQVRIWISTMATTKKGKKYVDRAKRLAEYADISFEKEEELRKAWRAIENAANIEPRDALVMIFMLLPDQAEKSPFKSLYGRRSIDPGEEKARYNKLLDHVEALQELLNPHRETFQYLLSDSQATENAQVACFDFRQAEDGLIDGLRKLRTLLKVVDPMAKIPTKHWKAEDADIKNYVILIAALNRYLSRPQHAALAVLANANYPAGSITADQLRKAWANGADKRA